MDKIVGRIVKKLDDLGLRENTLILFTGDNGTACRIQGRMRDGALLGGGKGLMTDAGTRVPLIASWPAAMGGGAVSDALVDLSDFLPTVAEAAGAKVPAKLKIDGKSFLPVLLGEKKHVRDWIFCHYNAHPAAASVAGEQRRKYLARIAKARKQRRVGRWARTQRYKLYDTGAFFDVSRDVLEKKPINVGKGSPEAEAARKMLQKVHDSMPAWDAFSKRRPKKAGAAKSG